MKQIYVLAFLVLVFSSSGFGQATVSKLPGLEGGNFTSIVQFHDTLYTITWESDVFHSADNGVTWQKDSRFNLGWEPAFSVQRNSFLEVDDQKDQLYIGGSFGLMIYASGTVQIPTSLPDFFGSRGAFGEIVISDSALYASYQYQPSSQGEVIKSTDDGINWTTLEVNGRFFEHLSATDDGKLLGASGNDLFLSETGGTGFTELTIPTESIDAITDILVFGDTFYISSFVIGIQSSNDQGATWTQVHQQPAFSLHELNNGSVLAAGLNAHVYISSDDGASWSDTDLGLVSTPFNYQGIVDILEMQDGTWFASTMKGDVYNNDYFAPAPGVLKSTDEGVSWSTTSTGLTAQTIIQIFKDDETGDIYLFAGGSGVHLWDADSKTWTMVGTPPDLSELQEYISAPPGWSPIGSVLQLGKNRNTGELVVVSEYVTLVLDAATDIWTHKEYEVVTFLNPQGLHFYPDGMAIFHETLGAFQGFYTSTDFINWNTIEIDFSTFNITEFTANDDYLTYFDAYAIDPGVGSFFSADMGETWTHIQADREGTFLVYGYQFDTYNNDVLTSIVSYPAPNYTMQSAIEIYDLETSNYSEVIFSSEEEMTDPMATKPYQLPNGELFSFVTAMVEYQPTPMGYFYYTGDTWIPLSSELPTGEADEITIVANNEVIFRYGADMYSVTIGGSGVSNEEEVEYTANSFEIFQNYPNPFNPTTTLQFQLAQASETKINVYNLLGQKVDEINLGKLSSGLHSIDFDASTLSSGVYFYTIQAGGSLKSGKMTLVK